MKLSERALLMKLSTGSWSGQLIDQTVTDETNTSHKAGKDAGHYKKQIVSRKFLSHVNSKISAAKKLHEALTLPWEDGGTRILSAMGYQRYTENMRNARLNVEEAATEFATADNLQRYKDEARGRLGTMYVEDDYPSLEELKGKFYIDVEPKPVPESGDFRTELGADTVKAITKDIEKRADDRVDAAVRDIYQRIADVTGKMVERLKDGENFHGTLVGNVQVLAELLPSLNITGDPAIDKLGQQMIHDLTDYSPEILRSDAAARRETALKAERIFAKAKQYLG